MSNSPLDGAGHLSEWSEPMLNDVRDVLYQLRTATANPEMAKRLDWLFEALGEELAARHGSHSPELVGTPPLEVTVHQDEIFIEDATGLDVVSWTKEEWTSNPQTTLAIANAIQLAHTDPTRLLIEQHNHLKAQIQ